MQRVIRILGEGVERKQQCWREVRALGNYDIEKLVEELSSAPWVVMD